MALLKDAFVVGKETKGMRIDNFNIESGYDGLNITRRADEDINSKAVTSQQNVNQDNDKLTQISEDKGFLRRKPSESVHNIVFDFSNNNNKLVGASNKLEDIDVSKALSEMKKDDVLSQYRFFVKPDSNLGTDKDGTVRKVIRDFNEM